MNTCPLCGHTKLKVIRKTLRHDIKRNVLACQKCTLIFLKPKKENLQNFYKGDYRKVYGPVIGKGATSKEIFDTYLPLQKNRVAKLEKYLGKNKRILDIGCSAGHFMFSIKNKVKECVGLEYNEANAEFVNKKLGIKTYTEPIEKTDLPEKYFDIIFCFEAFEHMDNPVEFLKTIKKYLKDDGMVYIEVPNILDSTLSVFKNKEFADFYFRDPHLFYYSPKTLKMIMEKSGYRGTVIPFQWYNFMNQLNWFFLKTPQSSPTEGLSDPLLVKSKNVPTKIKNDINNWALKMNKEYTKILEKHFISSYMAFAGKKK